MIKAIETSYKNYRFRSRLEARWAVFFDALGVKWEYEPEGYDLGEVGWYLPDFWLPETKTFVEVKPLEQSCDPIKTLYLAGKFTGGTGKNTPDDWREDFGVGFKGLYWGSANSLPDKEILPTNCGLVYVGPYPVDVSSGHGSSMGHFEDYWYPNDEDDEGEGTNKNKSTQRDPSHIRFGSDRAAVARKCLSYIDMADVVFAWIHTCDCYGTLAEIGYAVAKGKHVIVGVLDTLGSDDMWFAQQMANVCVRAPSARDAFDYAYPMTAEEKKADALAKNAKAKIGIVYGTPVEHNTSIFSDGYFIRQGRNQQIRQLVSRHLEHRIAQAAAAARSARFEHGEQPNV